MRGGKGQPPQSRPSAMMQNWPIRAKCRDQSAGITFPGWMIAHMF
jgi:hypothetical protein